MIKKVVSFVCCLLPIGAGAVVVNPESGQNSISTEQTAWTDAITAGNTITINSSLVNGIVSGDGFAIADNMFVGAESDQGSLQGSLYVLNTVQNPFTVVTSGDVSIGALLQVLDGKTLGFKTSDASPDVFNLTVGNNAVNDGIKIGSESQTAVLTLQNVDALTVKGSVIAYGNFTANAKSMDLGLVNANAGSMNLTAAGDVAVKGLVASSDGATNITAGADFVSDGTVQNNDGVMNLNVADNISVTGNVENKSTGNVKISGADLSVSGTMTNESQNATMTLNLKDWTVNGGSQSSYSFVNAGNLFATVQGQTYMEYGMNLGGMAKGNVFNLDTGTLVFGDGANSATWFNAFSNYLDSFNLAVRDGDINATTILNGINSDGVANVGANMSILAQNVTATTIRNNGEKLVVKAADLESGYDVVAPAQSASVGNINVSGQVVSSAGTTTDVIASGVLSVQGAVSNNGDMTLNGNTVNVASVSNAGVDANLTISSLTAASGTVDVSGNVTNTQGTTTIWAKDVSVGGTVTNYSGTTTIRGSDTNGADVQIGAVDAVGGIVNLDALAGAANIDGDMTVSGGAVNVGASLHDLTVGGAVQIAGNLVASANNTTDAGNVNVAVSGTQPFVLSAESVVVDGGISVVEADSVRNVLVDSDSISVGSDVNVANKGRLTLGIGNASSVDIAGVLSSDNGGMFESFANDLTVGAMNGDGLFVFHGKDITANASDIDVGGNVYFDAANDPVAPASGLLVRDTDQLTVKTSATDADINVGAVSVGAENTLMFDSADAVTVGGVITNNGTFIVDAAGDVNISNELTNSTGKFEITGSNVNMNGVSANAGDIKLTATSGSAVVGDIATSNSMKVSAADYIEAGAISQTGGTLDLNASVLNAQSLVVNGAVGTQANLNVSDVNIDGNVIVSGDFVQGGTSGMLNLNATDFASTNLTIGGDFIAESGNALYEIGTNATISGDFNVASGAVSNFVAGNRIVGTAVQNRGTFGLQAGQGISLGDVVNESGVITLDSGNGITEMDSLVVNAGNVVLRGAGADVAGAISTGAMLYQNWGSVLSDKDINILSDDYELTTSNLVVSGINQDGKLVVNTSDVDVGGNIIATDLRFAANPSNDWQEVDVLGSVSGNVDFIGLEQMKIGGNYIFNDGSSINAAILPYATGVSANTTNIDYWANISLNDDQTLGQITNPTGDDARALITVAGKFETELNALGTLSGGTGLPDGQVGISIFDVVDQGTAIWFLHADGGVADLDSKIRNLNVNFCNADGSICYNYFDSLTMTGSEDSDDLPAYITVRDVNEDGTADSLYIVFDPRFGGPVEVFKIQPVVEREADHTSGEYVSAGALDDMIAGQLVNKKFYNDTPIEVIPLIFEGTNLSTMANELYDRMEDYAMNRDGGALARFSRLFQVRELEQIAGSIALNEHTSFRSFEDRMINEFIWNRNRQLKKAWLDVDYGMFYQNIADGKHTDGNRFSISGGFDWQESDTLILGLTGRVSHMTSDSHDAMDLSYAGTTKFGDVKIEVADTNVGFGAYLMKIMGEKTRLYGNAFLDAHVFDVDRFQTFMDTIDGDGTSFSLITEWGLMHDVLNQYVVGNLYARAGYNFGFNVKEKAAGDDYMRLKSDGYFMLTPGYSLTAQKRIYPSAWFQIRPYVSVGVEYDLLGMPDYARYKFAVADEFTKYNVDIDPFWANIGGGIEFLSARCIQFGVDYRYQYNSDIQLHNIKVSGSYRF